MRLLSLWVYIKDNSYVGNSKTAPDLVAVIKTVDSNIKDEMLEKVFTRFRRKN